MSLIHFLKGVENDVKTGAVALVGRQPVNVNPNQVHTSGSLWNETFPNGKNGMPSNTTKPVTWQTSIPSPSNPKAQSAHFLAVEGAAIAGSGQVVYPNAKLPLNSVHTLQVAKSNAPINQAHIVLGGR